MEADAEVAPAILREQLGFEPLANAKRGAVAMHEDRGLDVGARLHHEDRVEALHQLDQLVRLALARVARDARVLDGPIAFGLERFAPASRPRALQQARERAL